MLTYDNFCYLQIYFVTELTEIVHCQKTMCQSDCAITPGLYAMVGAAAALRWCHQNDR
jgi:hypothetical protein